MNLFGDVALLRAEIEILGEKLSLRDEVIEQLRQICDAQREWIRVRQLSDTAAGIISTAEIARLQAQLGK